MTTERRWLRMEEWLVTQGEEEFTSQDLADSLCVSGAEASRLIGAYLQAQRNRNVTTAYVLKRTGRTSNAVWTAGKRMEDGRVICGVLFDDVHTKVRRAFAPDLERLAMINPRAARFVEGHLEGVINGALVVLATSLEATYDKELAPVT